MKTSTYKTEAIETRLIDKAELEDELSKQNEFFNAVLGFACFTLALACVGMPNPQKSALACLIIVVPLLLKAWTYFPPSIAIVKELAKEEQDPHAIALYNHLMQRFYGIKPMLQRNLMFWAGFGFYLLVLGFPELSTWMKS